MYLFIFCFLPGEYKGHSNWNHACLAYHGVSIATNSAWHVEDAQHIFMASRMPGTNLVALHRLPIMFCKNMLIYVSIIICILQMRRLTRTRPKPIRL